MKVPFMSGRVLAIAAASSALVFAAPLAAHAAVIKGNDLGNWLNGTNAADEIHGYGGNDVIGTGYDSVRDVVYAGAGNDIIHTLGPDEVYGGPGDDTINVAYPLFTSITCGTGNDTVRITTEAPYRYTMATQGCERVISVN